MLISTINVEFTIASSQPPSSEKAITSLQAFSEINVPTDYLDFIRQVTEVELQVSKQMYIRIWGAAGCLELNEAYHIQKYIPNSLAIGDNEGGSALVYLTGTNGFGLYIIGFGDLDANEAVFITTSLEDLLVRNIGIDTILAHI
jgi:hypothetical protein